jgi:uncharacterized membrane protein (DUF373 family)
MDKKHSLNVQFLRRFVIVCDDLMHFAVALFLLVCSAIVLVRAVPNLFHNGTAGILATLNDVLLALIFLEILWPVVRYLRREPFSLNPFLYVGIISSTRRILLIEAEHSVAARVAEGAASTLDWQVPVQLGVNVGVILVLAVALRLTSPRGVGNEEGH